MGAWGVLAFDNDDANDWASRLETTADLSLVVQAFARVGDTDEYLEAPQASKALAACEVLARQPGRPGYHNAYTNRVDVWVAQHSLKPPAALLARGRSVIDRILNENSELRQLWAEGNPSAWLAAVEDLRNRLRV